MTTSFTWDQFILDNKKFYISEHKKSEAEFKKREQQRKATTRVNIGVFGWNDDAQNFIRQFSPKDGYNITVWDDAVEDCSGECNGDAVEDVCGECNGSETDHNSFRLRKMLQIEW